MKYIKKYEQNDYQFNIGDFVKIDTLVKNVKEKVYVVNKRMHLTTRQYYVIDIVNGRVDDDVYSSSWEDESNLRLATPDEVERYEMKNDIDKYNL
jgi:hypothetical protein